MDIPRAPKLGPSKQPFLSPFLLDANTSTNKRKYISQRGYMENMCYTNSQICSPIRIPYSTESRTSNTSY